MSSAVRLFMLGEHDELYRLPAARYARMLREPALYPLEGCANRRVRCAECVVELAARKAVRVLRIVCWNADFDERGALDTAALGRHSVASLVAALAKTLPPEAEPGVVDAGARFVARGGAWKPTPAQTAALSRAALGECACALVPS